MNALPSAQAELPLHVVLTAAGSLAPFDDGPGRAAVLTALRRFAEAGELVFLAFAVRPTAVEVLLAPVEPAYWPARLRSALTRAVNRALRRTGALFADGQVVNALDASEDWVALADGIEASVDGLPGESLATSACAAHAGWVRQNPVGLPRRKASVDVEGVAAATIGEVVEVADVPTVVQLTALRSLAAGLRAGPLEAWLEPLRAYVGRWFLGDRRTLAVVRTVLTSLTQTEHGGGFFVSGLYGAGKSHLLAALALLAEFPAAREEAFAAHEPLRDLAVGWPAARCW